MKEKQEPPPKKKTKQVKLSHKELEELMNMHVDTYKRGKGGAIRRK